uniref:Uncharacterized protein n=1 Tax=Globodera rostochiensis TaxID=31243 RepID=A0A914H889_GLORO
MFVSVQWRRFKTIIIGPLEEEELLAINSRKEFAVPYNSCHRLNIEQNLVYEALMNGGHRCSTKICECYYLTANTTMLAHTHGTFVPNDGDNSGNIAIGGMSTKS